MFYNCPEESAVDNSLIPEKVLKILKHETVKKVFARRKSAEWIQEQLNKLWLVIDKDLYWTENFGYKLYGQYSSVDYFVETWYKNLNNKAYWEEKKKEKR